MAARWIACSFLAVRAILTSMSDRFLQRGGRARQADAAPQAGGARYAFSPTNRSRSSRKSTLNVVSVP